VNIKAAPIIVLAVLALVMACAESAPYRFAGGQFQTSYNEPFERTYEATLASLGEMGMPVTQTQKDAVGANIQAQRVDGTPVSITLQTAGPERTNANIRVGATGDEPTSRVIANTIADRLGEAEREMGRGGARPYNATGAQGSSAAPSY